MAHQNRLANAHVLVFGGTSGIGFAIANMALSNGARVTISGSVQPKVDQKVEKLRSFYPSMSASHVAGFACDLSDADNMEANVKSLLEKVTEDGQKKIDHVAYTAGSPGAITKVTEVTPTTALGGFALRYTAPAIIAKLLMTGKYMPLTADSSLTFTGGTNTHRPYPGWTFVAARGAAADGLVRGLAVDMAPLRVNQVVPGAIQTELLQPMIDRLGEAGTDKFKKDNSLMGTVGKPEDIAEAYGYLMKDRFASGSFVTSDGGRLLVTPSLGL
jgi:NAD(P)-dependent dehydrogenase (short-subunit alcohol dehydrogenase family)